MITDYQRYFDNIPDCPHCGAQLSCCESPPMHVGDGLGWGSEVLYICLNDDCPLFVDGWQEIEEKYGHRSSYRYMQLPGSNEANLMMVGSRHAFKGSIIDPEALAAQNARFRREKQALEDLESSDMKTRFQGVMTLILDEAAAIDGRKRAAAQLKEINDLSCIDPIRNHRFRDTSLESECNLVIAELLRINYKKECPHCAELIKAQANVCLHCKRAL